MWCCTIFIYKAIGKISELMPLKLSEVGADIAGNIDPYTYKDSIPKDFFSYNMESQAEILADYFTQEFLGAHNYIGKSSNRRIRMNFFYEKTLENFFEEIEKSNRRPRDLTTQWEPK